MKRVFAISICFAILILAGCQSVKYRWLNNEMGLPSECSRSYETKNMVIRYCLVEDAPGVYHFEGLARSRSQHSMGRITSGHYYLLLYKGEEFVERIKINRQGDQLDRAVKLGKDFKFNGDFNQVFFTWDIRYRI